MGREGARQFYQMFLAAFPDARVTVDTMPDEGDLLEDGQIVERWSEADFRGLLQQIGAVPA